MREPVHKNWCFILYFKELYYKIYPKFFTYYNLWLIINVKKFTLPMHINYFPPRRFRLVPHPNILCFCHHLKVYSKTIESTRFLHTHAHKKVSTINKREMYYSWPRPFTYFPITIILLHNKEQTINEYEIICSP